MIIHDLYLLRSLRGPAKADAELVVDSDAVLALAVALQSLKPIAWRGLQIM
jgi:hypothetical protein